MNASNRAGFGRVRAGNWTLKFSLGLGVFFMQTFGATATTVTYTLSYLSPGSPKVHVRVDLSLGGTAPRTFLVPRAVPMGYGEEPYDRFVSDVRAWDPAGKSLAVLRKAGSRWQVGSAARVEYDMDLARMEQEIVDESDSSRVRQGFAFMLGYSIFGVLEGFEDQPVQLHINGPDGWSVLSTLAPSGGAIRAKDFYALADSQVAMGPGLHVVNVHYSREKDTPLTLAMFSETNVDEARLERLSGEAMKAVMNYFVGSGSTPFQHYTVLLQFILKPPYSKHTYGFGMEHLESFHVALETSDANPSDFPDLWFRYFIAHHMAHAWIPKRCYGTGYYPFSWGATPKIDTIWFSEGFAQYAAMVAVAKDEGELQQMLDHRFRSVLRAAAPELRRIPLGELSIRASTNYVEGFRVAQLTFSRGALMAQEMETRIRTETHGQKSLRDALRALVSWSEQNHRAFRIEELPASFYEATGVDTKATLEKWMAPLN